MIELVEEMDLLKLNRITGDSQFSQKQAVSILKDIIGRMPHPRAYVCEPNISDDDPLALLWLVTYDILTAVLRYEDGVSIVEPDTLRELASNSLALENFTTAVNPFIMTITAMRLVDTIYFPDYGIDPKRRKVLQLQAKSMGITAQGYRPRLEMCRMPRVSPPIV